MMFQYHIARITPSAAVHGRARCLTVELFTTCNLDVQCMGVPFTTINTSRIDLQGVPLSTASSMDYGRAGEYAFPPPAVWTCRVCPFLPCTSNIDVQGAGMSDCPASSQSGTEMNRNAYAGPVRDRNKGTPVQTEMINARMPMPAASTSMPMPSYCSLICIACRAREPLGEAL